MQVDASMAVTPLILVVYEISVHMGRMATCARIARDWSAVLKFLM